MTIQQAMEIATQHHRAGEFAQAEAIYRQVLEVDPHHSDALHLLGLLASQHATPQLAVEMVGRAIAIHPNIATYHHTLGNALRQLGRIDEALVAYATAVELTPDSAQVWMDYALAHVAANHPQRAAEVLRQAMAQIPDHPDLHNNLGLLLHKLGDLDEAAVHLRKAVALRPDQPLYCSNLGTTLQDNGEIEEAVQAFRNGVDAAPDDPFLWSCYLYELNFDPHASPALIREELERWRRIIAQPLRPHIQPASNDRSPDRRLRIGYVSPNFNHHVVARNLLPLLRRHDHAAFEIFCYSDHQYSDDTTAEIKACCDTWRDCTSLSHQQLIDQIRSDRIDLLVDLALHMEGNRLPVFACKPAPVQICFAAYPGSTGLDTIDYRLTDPHLEPPDATEPVGPEAPLRMLESFWCYEDFATDEPPSPPPAVANGWITFGCLNNFSKVNAIVLDLWARVLEAVPDSRIRILAPDTSCRQRVVAALGVERDRIEFVGFCDRDEYLRRYQQIDISLDTYPYNGHTTSLDAWWMGVPVVSLCGTHPVSRAGISHARNLGMTDVVTQTPDDYLSLAVALAGDLPRLVELRRTLRQRMAQSPLMDGLKFARSVETAYRSGWEAYCRLRD
jgi:predicted O-linked N-acetylglucosamine transferase (SPINDLY family)